MLRRRVCWMVKLNNNVGGWFTITSHAACYFTARDMHEVKLRLRRVNSGSAAPVRGAQHSPRVHQPMPISPAAGRSSPRQIFVELIRIDGSDLHRSINSSSPSTATSPLPYSRGCCRQKSWRHRKILGASTSLRPGTTSHHSRSTHTTATMAPSFEQLDPETEYDDDDDLDFSGMRHPSEVARQSI